MMPTSYKTFRTKRLCISFLVQTRALVIMLFLSIFLLALMMVSLSSGSTDIPFNRVIMTLIGYGNAIENFTIITLRLPRILLGVLVGVGLALSGAILQGLIRNPLAAPDVIGVNSGASLMAVIFITVLHDYFSIRFLPLFAFAGALLVVIILYALAWKNGVTPFRLILIGFGITSLLGAFQTVLMVYGDLGRYPHQNWFNQWTKEDEYHVWEALKITELEDLAERSVESLSGGQRQRAWIAMTLAQNTEVILLDEPTTYLDLNHQVEVLDILFELNRKKNRTIVMVLHDLNLAARYADHIVAVADQTVVASGAPDKIMNCELIKKVFGMDCIVSKDPLFGTPMCIPYGKGMKTSRLKVAK